MATNYKWTDPATGQETAQGIGTPTPITQSVPSGATKISDPNYLKTAGLTEKDIFRSGKDIYQLPKIDTTLDVQQPTPDVPTPEKTNDVSSFMAGLDTSTKGTQAILEQINKKTEQEQMISEKANIVGSLSENAAKAQEKAIPITEQFGLTENTKNLQAIMPQIASIKAQFDNAEIAQEGRKGLAGSIYGRQALIQRQRAVELAGLSAIAQAYQGNIELAQSTAKNMVDMELAPIQTRIDDQKWQIEQLQGQLTDEQNRKAESLKVVLDERQRLLDEEKEKKTNISNLAITAAQNGADQATIEKIMKAGDYMTAIKLSSQFLQEGKWTESEITDANGNPLLYNENTGEYKTSVGTSTSDIFFTDANGDSWNIAGWATDQTKPNQMNAIAKQIGKLTDENLDEKVAEFTPALTSDMIKEASAQSGVSWEAIMTMVVQEAQGGLSNVAKNNNNFGGLTFNSQEWIKAYGGEKGTARPSAEGGNYIKFPTKQAGLNAMAALMASYGKVDIAPQTPEEVSSLTKLVQEGKLTEKEALTQVSDKNRINLTSSLALTPKESDSETDIIAKEKANIALSLIDHKGLNNAVGTISLGRKAPFQWGEKTDFINSIEYLVSGLSLQSLIDAKAQGATFGALSNEELKMLSSSATKIGNMRVLDKDGNVIGYRSTEKAFRDELENISKIFLKGVKGSLNNSINSDIQSTTPMISGELSSGIKYQVIQ